MKRVFSKEKFIEVEGIEDYKALTRNSEGKNWVDVCDGLTAEEMAFKHCCLTTDNWMVEVEDKEESKESEEKDMKFKVGDIIIGNKKASEEYNITKEKWIGKVTKVDVGRFNAKSLKGNREFYCLEYDCFDLYNFSKENLQFGDVVTTRNGEKYVVADDRLYGEYGSYDRDCDGIEDVYDDELKCVYDEDEDDRQYDIMKVERRGNLIYSRKENEKSEVKEMTVAEISKALGYEVKVVK